MENPARRDLTGDAFGGFERPPHGEVSRCERREHGVAGGMDRRPPRAEVG